MDNKYNKIYLNLKLEHVNKFCTICDEFDFDINVICGKYCVDGKSAMGVMGLGGNKVLIAPVTDDEFEIERFFRLIEPLGAYKTEDF